LLDVLLNLGPDRQYEGRRLRGDGLDVTGDWMTTLLQTQHFTAFRRRYPRRFSCACSASTIAGPMSS